MISLIICTYKRAFSLKNLLVSINAQTLHPGEVLIVDGSPDNDTKEIVEHLNFDLPIKYFNVLPEERGLTRQRNFGLKKFDKNFEIVCFLDDDVILENDYFQLLNNTFIDNVNCVGVGGFITNMNNWIKYDPKKHVGNWWFVQDNYSYKLSQRNYARKLLGLSPNVPNGFIPSFGHCTDTLPPSGNTYEVEHLIGCNMSFSSFIFNKITFSEYFIGYGLYEDFDFSLRATKLGKLYINTNLKLEHHHHPSGRPNNYKYGKMVTRNGWYVWRLKNKTPLIIDRIKWNAISLLLALFLLKEFYKKKSIIEFIGRIVGLLSLIINRPKIEY